MLQRLAMQGAALRANSAMTKSRAKVARPFRLDVRQRVVVKALVCRHRGVLPGGALAAHVGYLHRSGAGRDGERGEFYGHEDEDGLTAQAITREWANDRHHFRFIVSAEYGDRLGDLKAHTREMMQRVADDLGQPKLQWLAIDHFDTDQPHSHVLVRGRRDDGRDLVIPRAYISYGFRARAQEVAQERLGDLSRSDAERRIWRETQGRPADAVRPDAAGGAGARGRCGGRRDGQGRKQGGAPARQARSSGRPWLGSPRSKRRCVGDADLASKLQALSGRRDVIRTLNQRRLEGVEKVAELGAAAVSGQVVQADYHDELGSRGYVFVRDASGVEHYGALKLGEPLPDIGRQATLQIGQRGVALDHVRSLGRGT